MKSVAIIGAGMAGLAAAEVLLNKCKITLFEATDRVGGRAFTQAIDREVIDWGCEALEAGPKAPTAVLEKFGTETKAPGECHPLFRQFGDGGNGIGLALANSGAEDTMAENVEAAKKSCGRGKLPLADGVTTGVTLSPGASRIAALTGEYGSFSESSILGESSAFDRGRSEFLQECDDHEGETMFFAEGLGQVVLNWARAQILDRKANLTVRLGTPVTLIRNVGQGVELVPKLRKHGLGELFDAVIVTVPTGVISSGALTINDLSGEQMAAFRDCPLGHYHKVAVTGFGELQCPGPNQRVYMCDPKLEYAFFLSASPAGTYYMAHIAGEQAIFCNQNPRWTEEMLVAMLVELNPKASNHGKLTFHHSDWHTNEYVGGAYSYSKVNKPLARQTLSQLTVGNIYFAGEACSLMWYGNLAGAMETGQDAAVRLLEAFG